MLIDQTGKIEYGQRLVGGKFALVSRICLVCPAPPMPRRSMVHLVIPGDAADVATTGVHRLEIAL